MSLLCGREMMDYPARIWKERYPKAKKSYRCDECGGAINPGDEYYYNFCVDYDGYQSTYRACEKCSDLWDSLEELGYCRMLGELRNAYQLYLQEVLGQSNAWVVPSKAGGLVIERQQNART